MAKMFLSIKRTCIFACLAIGGLILEAMPGINMPGGIKKAVFSNNGLLYVLAKQEMSISVYSADGSLQRSVLIDPTNSLKLQGGEPQDFIVDAGGDIYCLTFLPELPYHQSGIVRIGQTGGAATIIPLSKPLNAFQMNRDLTGNFYVLGYEPDINESLALKKDLPSIVNIVHKYSPSGKYLGSLLPVIGASVDEKLLNAMRRPSSFVVLPNGEVWFFELRVDPQMPPWQNDRAVYHVDENGFTARVDPASPPNHFMIGIHEYAGNVAFEWANMESSLLRLLTGIDGIRIGTVEGGNIQAIRGERAISSRRVAESGELQLVLVPIN